MKPFELVDELKGRLGEGLTSSLLGDAQHSRDYSYERIHAGAWHQVDVLWRELYGHSMLELSRAEPRWETRCVELDRGWMMAGPHYRNLLLEAIDHAEREPRRKRPRLLDLSAVDTAKSTVELKGVTLEEVKAPSLESFGRMMTDKQCVKLLGIISDWAAMDASSTWHWSIANILRLAGHRLVPVEIGASYTSDEWRQELMTLVTAEMAQLTIV